MSLRTRALGPASIAFLLAGVECEALLYGFTASFGQPVPSLLDFQGLALASAYLVAAAAAGAKFFMVVRRIAREATLANAWTEPADLQTLRERLATYKLPESSADEVQTAKTRTRQLLDERLARTSGAAGASRRR